MDCVYLKAYAPKITWGPKRVGRKRKAAKPSQEQVVQAEPIQAEPIQAPLPPAAPVQDSKVEKSTVPVALKLRLGSKSCHLCYKMEEELLHECYALRGSALHVWVLIVTCSVTLLLEGLSASIEVKRSVCWNLIFDGRQNNWESWKWNGTTRWQNLLWALVGALFSSCWAETGETFGREPKNELLTSLCTYILQHSFECSMFVCVCTGACAGCMWWTWALCWSVEKISWPLLWDRVCHNDLHSPTYL